MVAILFLICVVIGFIMWFLATWPVPFAERVARGFFLAAALLWAYQSLGSK
jgi:hypothetical protein